MTCPACGASMTYVREDSSTTHDGITYRAYVYHCAHDNNWITHEEPQE